MHADASDRDRRPPPQPAPSREPGEDLSWMYRSEAFAEDLEDAPRISAVSEPAGRSPIAQSVQAVMGDFGQRLWPGGRAA